MSVYQSQSALEADPLFRQRVRACVVQETQSFEPNKPVDVIVSEIISDVAASPGFADKNLYGVKEAGLVPGQAAILDADILATVQPMLEDYRPVFGD